MIKTQISLGPLKIATFSEDSKEFLLSVSDMAEFLETRTAHIVRWLKLNQHKVVYYEADGVKYTLTPTFSLVSYLAHLASTSGDEAATFFLTVLTDEALRFRAMRELGIL